LSDSRYDLNVLIDIAVKIERSAQDFYKLLSKRFSEKKDVFKKISKEEGLHAEKYYQLLSRLDQILYSTAETNAQADRNIKVLEESGIVGILKEGEKRAPFPNLEIAIKEAVSLEKDTLIFYLNLAMKLTGQEKEQLLKIINEEHSHLLIVSQILKES
jgi:rubrerythrin